MAQGDFTKQNVVLVKEAIDELYGALPKSKKLNYLGHLNEIFLFLDKCNLVAPLAQTTDN